MITRRMFLKGLAATIATGVGTAGYAFAVEPFRTTTTYYKINPTRWSRGLRLRIAALYGHTHGGQIRLFGHSPVVPSRFGNRYAYGHIIEKSSETTLHATGFEKHLIVSGGLGCSILPVRFGVPPEIVVVDIGA